MGNGRTRKENPSLSMIEQVRSPVASNPSVTLSNNSQQDFDGQWCGRDQISMRLSDLFLVPVLAPSFWAILNFLSKGNKSPKAVAHPSQTAYLETTKKTL